MRPLQTQPDGAGDAATHFGHDTASQPVVVHPGEVGFDLGVEGQLLPVQELSNAGSDITARL